MIKHNGVITFFVRHRVAATLLMTIMILFGIWAIGKLNTQFLPNFALDRITVSVVQFGANAQDIERSITIPIEQELKDLENVKEIISISSKGFASFVIEFREGTDIILALESVKERVDSVRNLPNDSETPIVKRIERLENIASIMLSGPEDIAELRPWAEDIKNDLLKRGIAKVSYTGLPNEEIAVEVPLAKVAELNLSLPDIARRINNFSKDIPAGDIGDSEVSKEIRAVEQRRTAREFFDIPVQSDAQGRIIRLDDIATIRQQPRDDEVSIKVNGKPAVRLNLFRSENADSLKAARILEKWRHEAVPNLPSSIQVKVFDQSWILLKQRINVLLSNGTSGLILIILVLFFVLRARIAFWVTASIPVSFLAALAALYLFGGTINMVSLFAFIMSLGIIVDDSIVVGEEISTQIQNGERSHIAAITGAKKMFSPVLASSLTTIAAFIPLMVIGGIIGNIISTIPLVVICVIIASLIECFLILPAHIAHSYRGRRSVKVSPRRAKIEEGFNRFRDDKFRPIVTKAIEHRGCTIAIAVCLFLIAIAFVGTGRIPFTFFPSPDGTILNAGVKFSAGTPKTRVEQFLQQLQSTLDETNVELTAKGEDDIVQVAAVVENRLTTPLENSELGDNLGSVLVELSSPDSRKASNQKFIDTWKSKITLPPGVETFVIFARRAGPPGDDIDVLFYDGPLETLKAAAEELKAELATYGGVFNIQDDLPFGKAQYIFKLNATGEALKLDLQNVANQIRANFQGALAQIFYEGEQEIEVRVKLPENEQNSNLFFDTTPILTPDGQLLPLIAVVDYDTQRGVDVLRHTDGELALHVTADVNEKTTNANTILAELKASKLREIRNRYGIKYSLKGSQQDQAETLADMKRGMIVAVSLIYIILAWVFASYGWPLIVMAVIPLGITGALFGHVIMGIDLTILSLFGIFGLSGIVVNDSIILVSYYKYLRKAGMKVFEAIVEASCARLRAVLLTSITTVAGLTPLMFETSLQAQFLIPMAVSIAFGLGFATVLVLFVIPSLLAFYELRKERVNKNLDFVPTSSG